MIPETLSAVAIGTSWKAGFRRVSGFLAVRLLGEGVRAGFSWAREGLPRPFTGPGLALWLPDPATILAVPSWLVGTVCGWKAGVGMWAASFGYVAWRYPALRGPELFRFYYAVFLTAALVAAARVLWTVYERSLSKDETLMLLFASMMVGDTLLVIQFGEANWWGARLINCAAYIITTFVATVELIWGSGKDRLP